MKIEEKIYRASRGFQDEKIEIGSALQKFYNGVSGSIIRAMVNAITSEQFEGMDNHISAERKLGRAEGLAMLVKRIELAIQNMEELTMEIKEEQLIGG